MKTLRIGSILVLAGFLVTLSACNVRAGTSLSSGVRKDLAETWGAVVVTVPDRILWERDGTDRTEHGTFYLYENAEAARLAWTEAITDRLTARGFKLQPAQLVAAMESPLQTITPDAYAAAKPHTIVVESGNRGVPSPANGNGTQFLFRPFVVPPGGPQGVWVDRPSRYDFGPLAAKDLDYVVAVDLTEWVLVVGKNGSIRSGYTLIHVGVFDLARYRVRALGRIEKPAADRSDWIYGPAIRDASYVDLRRGRTSVLAPALNAAGPRIADLVERHMGLISETELRDRTYFWNE